MAAKFNKHTLMSGTEPSAIFDHIPDEAMQESGNVTIPLDSRSAVGSVVRVQGRNSIGISDLGWV